MITGISRFTKGEFNQDALDEVYNKGKELYKDPIAPPSSGIIENSLDLIYEDMNGYNIGYVSNMPGWGEYGTGQLWGPVKGSVSNTNWDTLNIWIEIEAAQEETNFNEVVGCGLDANKATNTRIEIAYIKGYRLDNGVWSKFGEIYPTVANRVGDYHPKASTNPMEFNRDCGLDEQDTGLTHQSLITNELRNEADGNISVKPEYYYRWHSWLPRVKTGRGMDHIYGVTFLRLVVEDTNEPDDRHLANYVAHISSDKSVWSPSAYVSDIGISRYKKVTNDWQPFNFTTDMTQAELEANPPPFPTTPY